MTTVKKRVVRPKPRAAPVQQSVLAEAVPPSGITHLKGVFFGPPKSGKTTVAMSGTGNKLHLLTEPEGDAPLVGREDVKVLRPEAWTEMHAIIRELRAPGHGYDRLVFDSVTFAFELIGGRDVMKAMQNNQHTGRAYGQAGAALNQLIHDALTLPMDVIFISQMKQEGGYDDDDTPNPEEGEYPITLAITPMVYKILTPAVSFIGRTFKRLVLDTAGKKTLRFGVSFEDYGKSPAGSRIAIAPEVMNFDLDQLRGGE